MGHIVSEKMLFKNIETEDGLQMPADTVCSPVSLPLRELKCKKKKKKKLALTYQALTYQAQHVNRNIFFHNNAQISSVLHVLFMSINFQ